MSICSAVCVGNVNYLSRSNDVELEVIWQDVCPLKWDEKIFLNIFIYFFKLSWLAICDALKDFLKLWLKHVKKGSNSNKNGTQWSTNLWVPLKLNHFLTKINSNRNVSQYQKWSKFPDPPFYTDPYQMQRAFLAHQPCLHPHFSIFLLNYINQF